MAQPVDCRTGDRFSLLRQFGVLVKPAIPCDASEEKLESNNAFVKDTYALVDKTGGDMQESSKGASAVDVGRHYDQGRANNRLGLQTVLLIFAVVCCVLLSAGLLIYVVRADRFYSSQVQELRERVNSLHSLCTFAHRPATGHGRAGDRGSVDDSESPWKLDFGVPFQWLDEKVAPPSGRYQAQDDRRGQHAGETNDALDSRGEEEEMDEEEEEEEEEEENNWRLYERTGISRTKRSSNGKNGKKTRRHRGRRSNEAESKHCRRYKNCEKAQANGKKVNKRCKKILDCVPTPPPSQFTPLAVHFTSKFWRNLRQTDFGQEAPLEFYSEADWMKKVYKDKSKQPIVPLENGIYNVTRSGLYLIYSSVLFHDMKPRQSQAVVVNGERRFKCLDSVDYVDRDASAGQQVPTVAKYKTCAMTGVTHLNADDRLMVQNLYAQTEIDLSNDATFFGAVLLAPGET